MKKIRICLLVLCLMLLTACGGKSKVNTITEMNDSVATGDAASGLGNPGVANDQEPDGKQEVTPDTVGDNYVAFKAGTWFCVSESESIGYFSFSADGVTGIHYGLVDGVEKHFSCIEENQIVSLIWESDVLISGDLEQLDENTGIITTQSDEILTFTYISEKTPEEFSFYSTATLLDMARAYQKQTTGFESVWVSYVDNEDSTLTIKLFTEEGEQITTDALYTINRVTATGKDELLGNDVDLKAE